jgi:hypothetical protein
MIRKYSYAVDDSVLEFFSASNKREREQLMRIFMVLADNPFQKGDYVQKSASGRTLQVKRFGKWLITYWPDDPVTELRVVDIAKVHS